MVRKHLPLLVLALATPVLPSPAGATTGGGCDDGCTPGYWKNHLDSWPEADDQSLLFDPSERGRRPRRCSTPTTPT